MGGGRISKQCPRKQGIVSGIPLNNRIYFQPTIGISKGVVHSSTQLETMQRIPFVITIIIEVVLEVKEDEEGGRKNSPHFNQP